MIIKKYADLGPPTYHYNGTVKTRFSKAAWTHFIEREDSTLDKLDGVTKIVHVIDKSEALIHWAVSLAVARARKLILERGLGPDGAITLFVSELDAILAEAKRLHKDKLEEAAQVGHEVHDFAEKLAGYINSGDSKRLEELLGLDSPDDRIVNGNVAVIEFLTQHNVRFVVAEKPVLSLKHHAMGTLDGVIISDSCTDKKCCPIEYKDRRNLLDYKTCNSRAPYLEYLLQTAFYVEAWHEQFPEQPIVGRWIVILDKETGSCNPWYFDSSQETDFAAFLHCLALVRSLKVVDDNLEAVKDARKEVIALQKVEAMKVRCSKADDYKGVKLNKCLPDGTQCETCKKIWEDNHGNETPVLEPAVVL